MSVLASMAACAAAAAASSNSCPMTGRRRPAAASARAVRTSPASSSGLAAAPAGTVTCLASASSAVTGAKLPLAMPNGQNRPPAASSPNAASPMSPPTPSNTTSTSPTASRTCSSQPSLAVVDGQVGPEIPRDRELARLAGQRHDPGPGVAGDLHKQRPHAPGRGLDQDGVARAQARPVGQGERRPAVGQQRDRVAQGHPVRDLDQPRGRHDRAFGVPARAVQAGHDPAPGAGASGSGPGHRAADAVAQDGRQRREHRRMRRPPGPDLGLDERHVGDLDLDDHLARGLDPVYLVHLGGLEHLRRPELPHHHGTHDGASFIGANLSD